MGINNLAPEDDLEVLDLLTNAHQYRTLEFECCTVISNGKGSIRISLQGYNRSLIFLKGNAQKLFNFLREEVK